MIKERRINNASHVRNLLQEQINILRLDESIENVDRARAIGYLSNIALSVIKVEEIEGKIKKIMEQLNLE